MRFGSAAFLLVLGTAAASAQTRAPQRPAKAPEPPPVRVEMQESVPPLQPMQTEIVLPPSACRLRLSAELAEAPSIPPRAGPGSCGGEDLVRLEAVHLPDKSRISVSPPAILRCTMAEALVEWVRREVPPTADALGARITAVDSFAAYDCRGRNNQTGAKLSEHGMANAFDLRGFKLATGKTVDLTDAGVDRGVRERVRGSLCERFTTVLGPGSDRYHENHIHLDLIQRRGGYRMCQWDVRDPAVAVVPLPPERPADLRVAAAVPAVAPAPSPVRTADGPPARNAHAPPVRSADVPLPVPRPKELAALPDERRTAPASGAGRRGETRQITTGRGEATSAPEKAARPAAKPRRAERRRSARPRMPWDGWFR